MTFLDPVQLISIRQPRLLRCERRPCGDAGQGGEGGLSWNVTSDHLKLGGRLDFGSEHGKCKDEFVNSQPKRGKGMMYLL